MNSSCGSLQQYLCLYQSMFEHKFIKKKHTQVEVFYMYFPTLHFSLNTCLTLLVFILINTCQVIE